MQARCWKFQALTDIWTGDARGQDAKLIPTGLLGSIRWWFEVLVRGLGGSACDPTRDGNRCPEKRPAPLDNGHHCVACELFGCTGWARKFRFDVLDREGNVKRNAIRAGKEFRIKITPLRPIHEEEWELLDATFRLIAGWGAIGGKTIFKPSDEEGRSGLPHHRDYGIIEKINGPADLDGKARDRIEAYLKEKRWRKCGQNAFTWASLERFWFVEGGFHLARKSAKKSTFNHVLGRPEPKKQSRQHPSDGASAWLAGRQRVSKKVFSFKRPKRTFGFTCPGTVNMEEIRRRLKAVGADPNAVKCGDDILKDLFPGTAGRDR